MWCCTHTNTVLISISVFVRFSTLGDSRRFLRSVTCSYWKTQYKSALQGLGSPNNLAERREQLSFTFIFRQTNLCASRTHTAATKQTESRRLPVDSCNHSMCQHTSVPTCCTKQQSSCQTYITTDFKLFFSSSRFTFHLLSRWFLARLILSPWRYSSKTSVALQRSTLLYIPEDSTLHNHRRENIESYEMNYCSGRPLLVSEHRKTTKFIRPVRPI
jgi:hypothetical protein